MMPGVGNRTVEPSAELNRLTGDVIGAAIEVHRVLGPGLLESVHEGALRVELGPRKLPFVRQPSVDLSYKGRAVGKGGLDPLVDNVLVVELKSVEALTAVHKAQFSYLKTTGYPLGPLINFNVPVLKDGIARTVLSP